MKNICTALKRIAIAATVYASLITGLNAQTNFIISSDTTWYSNPCFPIGNITVLNGVTFRMDGFTAYMDTSAVITVNTNATLEIVGAQLHPSQYLYFWKGIVLGTQSTLIMDGAEIRNAKTGVKTLLGNSPIQIEGSNFYNCVKSIELNNCPYNSNSYINRTTFEVAPISGTSFSQYCNYLGLSFSCLISASNSSIPVIAGCSFLNNNSGIYGYNYAITAVNSDVTITCFDSTRSLFRNFDCAISSTDNHSHALKVKNTDFEGNATGIRETSVGNTIISCNSFSLGNFDDTLYPYREGIVLNTCRRFKITGNNLYKAQGATITSSTGIYIKNNEGLNGNISSINGNIIAELTKGIHTTGNNLSNPSSGSTVGLEIYCNTITECSYGIYNNGQIGNPQGPSTGSAGNIFSNDTIYDIYNVTGNTLTYYYSSPTAPSVYNVSCIYTSSNNCQTVSCNTCNFRETENEETFSEERSENDIESKYALVETLKTKEDYESAEFELRQILYSGKLTESGYSEYETYRELFYLEKNMHEQGRDWETMTADERIKLNKIAKNGYGRAQHTAAAIVELYKISPETKQTSFGLGDFPLTCMRHVWDSPVALPVYDNELKFDFPYFGNICAMSGDTVFVQGTYAPANNEFPDGAPTGTYGNGRVYNGHFYIQVYFADENINMYEGTELCLNDKQCQDINLQMTCESDFATGQHYALGCARTITLVNGEMIANNEDDSLSTFCVEQRWEFFTPDHDFGDGTVTISWIGEDSTQRQHVFYFIIDDHFYIDYVGYGVEENEDVYASGVRVFPNPTNGTFTIEAEDITNVEIFDLAGQKVLTDRSGSQTVNAGSLPTGVYFLKVGTATETRYGKLVKR